jgi:magnesium-transporting ATPase (P-type)
MPIFRTNLNEACENLAMDGLRTLVFAEKQLTEAEFEQWNKHYEDAKTSMDDNRQELIQRTIELLEYDLLLLGVSGVEGKFKLQKSNFRR